VRQHDFARAAATSGAFAQPPSERNLFSCVSRGSRFAAECSIQVPSEGTSDHGSRTTKAEEVGVDRFMVFMTRSKRFGSRILALSK